MVQGRKMTNYGPDKILDLNTSFERFLSELSENHKIFVIGSTVLKLWLLKYVQTTPLFNGVTALDNEALSYLHDIINKE